MKKTYLLLILSLLPFLLFAETNSTTCILPTTILFKSGMKDTAKTKNITTLQMILYANGYLASKPTGSFGPATKKAVEAFQKEKKLKVTGITGKYTIDELNTLGCASYSNSAPTQITTKKVTIAVPSNNEKIISASSSLSKITEISNNKVIKNTSSQDTLTSNLKTITVSTVTQSVEVKPKDSSVNSVTIESLSADDKLKIEEDIKNVNGTEKDMTALVKLVLELKTLQKKRYDNFYTAPTTKSGLETDYALVQQIGSVESKIDSIYFAMYKANNNKIIITPPFAAHFNFARFRFPDKGPLTENIVLLASQEYTNRTAYDYYTTYLDLTDISQVDKDAIKTKLNDLLRVYQPPAKG